MTSQNLADSSLWVRDLTSGVCAEEAGAASSVSPIPSTSSTPTDDHVKPPDNPGIISYVDFSPRMLEDCQLSSESVEATLGPKYEELGCLVDRANVWLQNHPNIRVVSCETVQYDTSVPGSRLGVSGVNSVKKCSKWRSQEWVVVLRVLRLWVRVQTNLGNTVLQRLAYVTMVPDRLEVDPSQLTPKFENFAETAEKFRRRLRENPVPGRILSMETCELRMTYDNCEMNPDSTMWIGSRDKDFYCLSYLRMFFTQGTPEREDVGFKDFIPARTSYDDNQGKGESCSQLMAIANAWLRQQPNLHVINVQTVVCKMYPPSSTTQKSMTKLDTTRSMYVQFPNKTTNFLIVLRVYYTRTNNFQRSTSLRGREISYKTFIPSGVSDKRIHTPWSVTRTDMSKTLKKAAKWAQSTGAHIVGAETITVCVPRTTRKIDVDNSHMVTDGSRGGSRLLFALRIYYEGCYQNNGMLTRALSMERLKIHSLSTPSASDQCVIL